MRYLQVSQMTIGKETSIITGAQSPENVLLGNPKKAMLLMSVAVSDNPSSQPGSKPPAIMNRLGEIFLNEKKTPKPKSKAKYEPMMA